MFKELSTLYISICREDNSTSGRINEYANKDDDAEDKKDDEDKNDEDKDEDKDDDDDDN